MILLSSLSRALFTSPLCLPLTSNWSHKWCMFLSALPRLSLPQLAPVNVFAPDQSQLFSVLVAFLARIASSLFLAASSISACASSLLPSIYHRWYVSSVDMSGTRISNITNPKRGDSNTRWDLFADMVLTWKGIWCNFIVSKFFWTYNCRHVWWKNSTGVDGGTNYPVKHAQTLSMDLH